MAPSPFSKPPGTVALIVAPPRHNAWSVAATSTLDALAAGELATTLAASGRAVGLRGPADAGIWSAGDRDLVDKRSSQRTQSTRCRQCVALSWTLGWWNGRQTLGMKWRCAAVGRPAFCFST